MGLSAGEAIREQCAAQCVFYGGAEGLTDMMKLCTSTLFLTALLAGTAHAQTTPGSENSQAAQQPIAPAHMLPAVQKPGTAATPHKRRHLTTSATSNSSSSNSSSSTSPSASTAGQASPSPDATNPDQGKPGTQTNNTTIHTPGSENPADTGSTAPKN
jgi:hypothetical protein